MWEEVSSEILYNRKQRSFSSAVFSDVWQFYSSKAIFTKSYQKLTESKFSKYQHQKKFWDYISNGFPHDYQI